MGIEGSANDNCWSLDNFRVDLLRTDHVPTQARRQGGGSRGFERTRSPFDLQKIFMYTCKLHILSILPFESGPLVSLLLIVTAVQTSLVAATVCEFIHGGPARNTRATCLRRCDKGRA